LKRSGEGDGKWSRITWDQALEEMGKRFTALRRGGRNEALWVEMGRRLAGTHGLGFPGALGSPTVFSEGTLWG
jgi:anaerobic selenocysteine-containing dehydrogenase